MWVGSGVCCLLSIVYTPQHKWCVSQCDGVCDGSVLSCLVLSCRTVLLIVEWRWGVSLSVFSVFPVLLPSLFLCVGVRGSARAALRARTLSPNTIVFSCSSSLRVPRLSSLSVFLCWNGGGSPCVGVLGGHDRDG